jgi:hypothetical protein
LPLQRRTSSIKIKKGSLHIFAKKTWIFNKADKFNSANTIKIEFQIAFAKEATLFYRFGSSRIRTSEGKANGFTIRPH